MEVDAHTPELVAVGIDGSPASLGALAWAAEEASAHGRQLCVYHCWQQPMLVAAAVPGAGLPTPGVRQDARAAAVVVLQQAMSWLREQHPALPATGALLEGPAGRRLIAHARRDDLLVLGLGSRHRLVARVLGSTVEHALRQARGAVVVVPPDDRAGVKGPFSGHVVVAADLVDVVSEVVGAGFAEAAAHGWPLAVVHAEAGGRVAGAVALSSDATGQQRLNCAVESWHSRYPYAVVHRAAFRGSPAAVIEHVAAGARLLVVGRSSHPMRPVRLVDLLLSKVGCPIVVTPPATIAGVGRGAAPAAEQLLPLLPHHSGGGTAWLSDAKRGRSAGAVDEDYPDLAAGDRERLAVGRGESGAAVRGGA